MASQLIRRVERCLRFISTDNRRLAPRAVARFESEPVKSSEVANIAFEVLVLLAVECELLSPKPELVFVPLQADQLRANVVNRQPPGLSVLVQDAHVVVELTAMRLEAILLNCAIDAGGRAVREQRLADALGEHAA